MGKRQKKSGVSSFNFDKFIRPMSYGGKSKVVQSIGSIYGVESKQIKRITGPSDMAEVFNKSGKNSPFVESKTSNYAFLKSQTSGSPNK